MGNDKKPYVGEIPVFRFRERNPSEMRAHPETDTFMVYHSGNGNLPCICVWQDGAFWHRWGETDADWEIVVNVEYWFRLPTAEEVVDGENSG